MLYFAEKLIDKTQMEEFLFENLRLDREELAGFNRRDVKKLASLYGHNVKLLHDILETLK